MLDFGCGGGYLLRNLSCREKMSVAINPSAREVAEAQGIATVESSIDVADAWADVNVSNNALEHTEQPMEELRALYPKLKRGGLAVSVVPCESLKKRYHPGDINQHLYSWSPMCLGNLFTRAGFEVVSVQPYIHKWPPHYQRVMRLFGKRIFDTVCRIYGRVERSWSQVRIVARKP